MIRVDLTHTSTMTAINSSKCEKWIQGTHGYNKVYCCCRPVPHSLLSSAALSIHPPPLFSSRLLSIAASLSPSLSSHTHTQLYLPIGWRVARQIAILQLLVKAMRMLPFIVSLPPHRRTKKRSRCSAGVQWRDRNKQTNAQTLSIITTILWPFKQPLFLSWRQVDAVCLLTSALCQINLHSFRELNKRLEGGVVN